MEKKIGWNIYYGGFSYLQLSGVNLSTVSFSKFADTQNYHIAKYNTLPILITNARW